MYTATTALYRPLAKRTVSRHTDRPPMSICSVNRTPLCFHFGAGGGHSSETAGIPSDYACTMLLRSSEIKGRLSLLSLSLSLSDFQHARLEIVALQLVWNFVLIWPTSWDERCAFLVARHCALHCFVDIHFCCCTVGLIEGRTTSRTSRSGLFWPNLHCAQTVTVFPS